MFEIVRFTNRTIIYSLVTVSVYILYAHIYHILPVCFNLGKMASRIHGYRYSETLQKVIICLGWIPN